MDLSVDTGIPHGNACDIETITDASPPEVRFAADPHGGPEALWFCLQLRAQDAEPGDRVRLVLKHPGTMLGAGDLSRMRPAIQQGDGPWERLPEGEQRRLPDGRLEIGWEIDAPRTTARIAYCYPYGMGELRELLRAVHPAYEVNTIGVSQGGRPISRLSSDYGAEGSTRQGVYLLARQHSGETPGSWVLDGVLRRLAEEDSRSLMVWSVPLANIDGVEQGDYGKDSYPYDLNRAWGTPPMRHETLVLAGDILRWRGRCRPAVVIDFHAPGACESTGLYTFLPAPREPEEHHKAAEFLASEVRRKLGPALAADDFLREASYPSRWPTPGVTGFCSLNDIAAFTIETPYALVGTRMLSIADYQEAGQRVAEALLGGIDALK